MSEAEPEAGSRWIIGARWDVTVCLATVWFPALLFALWRGAEQMGFAPGETTLAVVVIGLGTPHFLTTFTFTYMDPDQRAYFGQRRLLYYAIPISLMIGSWLHCAFIGPTLLVTLWLLFGEHHVAAQNIGFLSLYEKRNGEGEVDRRIDHFVFNAAWITTVARYITREPGERAMEYFSRPTYAIAFDDRGGLVGLCLLVAVGALLVFLGRQVQRWWTGQPVSVPKLLFMLTTWPSFLVVPFAVSDLALVLILRSAYHNVQYIGLVYLLNRRRCAARGAPQQSGLLGRLVALGPASYLGLHVAAAAVVWLVTELATRHSGFPNDLSLRYLFYPGVPLAHFFLDGLTWRFSEPHARRTVLPYLGRAPSVPRGAGHVAA